MPFPNLLCLHLPYLQEVKRNVKQSGTGLLFDVYFVNRAELNDSTAFLDSLREKCAAILEKRKNL